MNEAQARATGRDCIYDPAADEWFIAADYAPQVAASLPEPALAKDAQAVVKPIKPGEAATAVETQSLALSNDAPIALPKTGKK